MDDESFINLFYLPPWEKMFSVKISFVFHGRQAFFLHFLSSSMDDEYFFLFPYLPSRRKVVFSMVYL